jgi:sugar lactone lactonase YvrE
VASRDHGILFGLSNQKEVGMLSRSGRTSVVSLLFMLFAATLLSAQSETAAHPGTVIDQAGAVLAGVRIVVRDPETGFERETIASAQQTVSKSRSSPIKLVYPNGLALDDRGELYISDIGTHRVLKLNRRGRLIVIAGTGEGGYSGDGGPAIKARLHSPHDLAFDAEGNLLVADTYNHRIRRIDRQGVITTIAGSGNAPYSGYGSAAPKDTLNNPQGIAVDGAGNILIADTYNRVVRRLDRNGTMTVIAGSVAGLSGDGGPANEAQLNLPMAVTVGPEGDIYVSDAANSRIRRITADGKIQTVTGFGGGEGIGGAGFVGDGGPAEKAKLFSPADVKFDAAGNLYISDSANNRLRVVRGGVITTIAGTGRAGFSGDGKEAVVAELNTPQKLAVAKDGSIFIADRANHRVRKIDARGFITTVAGESQPTGMFLDPDVIR